MIKIREIWCGMKQISKRKDEEYIPDHLDFEKLRFESLLITADTNKIMKLIQNSI